MLDSPFIFPPSQLPALNARTKELNFNMASEPRTGALLQVLAASKMRGRMLELGTGTGIGTAWLLSGMDGESSLISIDTDPEVQGEAKELLGGDRRLTLLNEDAAVFMRNQPKHSFDLIFADAMPGKYDLFEEAFGMLQNGGFYLIDDMLPQPNWPAGHAERVDDFINMLENRNDLVITKMNWSTGIIIAVKK